MNSEEKNIGDPMVFDNSEDDLDYNIEEIYKKLQNIGSFTINDSKIYVTLLKIGLSNPAVISEKSKVDRARVYDSLKRLVKRGIVEEEPVKRAPRYRAFPPDVVFGTIRKKLNNQINLATSLEKQLAQIKTESTEKNSVWSIQGKHKINKKFYEIIQNAEEFCFIFLTLDYSISSINELELLEGVIMEKLRSNPSLTIKIALKIFPEKDDQKSILNRLFHANIEIFRWKPKSVLPFGLILTDSEFMQTFLSGTVPKPMYEFGILMEKAGQDQLMGFKHLCIWVFYQLCKKLVFTKTQRNIQIEGDDDE
ncbi:TrmB family transcriptional regulator [Promethearchaeum syntrophicum]|uniref:TrmB family transcriptional regulator n=1 Tax=Promethearchaeum syntrophicum TaxID=2594042 RepID=A0A5B9D9E2_9ARCH|nr:helix-turn-helix domain-containing protein [Candidatus Prometheoarchaeum syntrophicum]QEE15712.1 Sugar-specific transcriptional regulator TrmB [Candidatus Prometheoarchaeum syntrophicum]